MNRHTFLLDGDNVRHGLNKDLALPMRIGLKISAVWVRCKTDGCWSDRNHGVHLALPVRTADGAGYDGTGEFVEVFVDTPLSVAEDRMSKPV